MPVSSIPLVEHMWPNGLVDWHLNEADFPEVPAANLSTDRLAADGETWLDYADCLARPLNGGSAFTNLEGNAVDGQEHACTEIQEILRAQLIWESHTGFEFIPHREHEDSGGFNWLDIRVSSGGYGIAGGACSYNAHRWFSGGLYNVPGYHAGTYDNNVLRLSRSAGRYCSPQGYVHEFGHVLGLWHTQGRVDRDDWLRLADGAESIGMGINNRIIGDFSDVGPFDFRSIMIYHSYESNNDGTHESGLDCLDVSFGDPCGTIADDRSNPDDPITFVMSDVYNMMPFQPAHFARSSFRPTIEPLEGEDCFPASILQPWRVRQSPAFPDDWRVSGNTAGDPELIVPLGDLFANPVTAAGHPNLENYECYRIVRTGPDASDPDLRRAAVTADHESATFESGVRLSEGDRQGAMLSPADTSAAFHMYAGNLPGSDWGDPGDRFGTATASGDFDGDGVQDLAIAAPGENTVYVFKGIYGLDDSGLILHRPWLALDATGATALAVGDFDNDGFDDLAVGRSEQDAVRIFSRLGQRGYLQNVTSVTANGFSGSPIPTGWPPTTFDNAFGTALAVADFDGDGYDDLAVGCPGCYPANYDIGLHEPAGAPSGWGGWTERTGAVYLLRGDDVMSAGLPTADPVLKAVDPVIDPYSDPGVRGSHLGSQFGHSVTFGHHVGGGEMKLFVGAPEGLRFVFDGVITTTMSYLSGADFHVGRVYDFITVGAGSSAAVTFNGVSTEDELNSDFGFAVDSPVGDEWAPFQGALLVGSPTALVPHHSGAVSAGAVFGYAIPPSVNVLGPPTVRLDGRAIDTAFSDCTIAPNNGFGSAIGHGLTLGQTFAAADQLHMVAIGSPRRQVGCSNITDPSFGAVSTWFLADLRDEILNADPPSSPTHYIPNPDPAPTGPTGFGSDICFLRPSTWSFVELDGTSERYSTAADFSQGQVGLFLGAEFGHNAPGDPTGIVREIDPQVGGTTHVRPALFQGT